MYIGWTYKYGTISYIEIFGKLFTLRKNASYKFEVLQCYAHFAHATLDVCLEEKKKP